MPSPLKSAFAVLKESAAVAVAAEKVSGVRWGAGPKPGAPPESRFRKVSR